MCGESPRKSKAGTFLTLTFSGDHRTACQGVRPSPECPGLGPALSVSGDDSQQARSVRPVSHRQRDWPGPAGFPVSLSFCPSFASGLGKTKRFPGVRWVERDPQEHAENRVDFFMLLRRHPRPPPQPAPSLCLCEDEFDGCLWF